ncbi:MAG: hypothetical protein KAY24_15630 [Candidatus Eisenbacteria sp.]|nr:hypothetical protein [Candidatus Eisenbacteria bacterium]
MAKIESAINQLRVGAPTWMAIIGPRKVGKTSLVLEEVRLAATRGDEVRVKPAATINNLLLWLDQRQP